MQASSFTATVRLLLLVPDSKILQPLEHQPFEAREPFTTASWHGNNLVQPLTGIRLQIPGSPQL